MNSCKPRKVNHSPIIPKYCVPCLGDCTYIGFMKRIYYLFPEYSMSIYDRIVIGNNIIYHRRENFIISKIVWSDIFLKDISMVYYFDKPERFIDRMEIRQMVKGLKLLMIALKEDKKNRFLVSHGIMVTC